MKGKPHFSINVQVPNIKLSASVDTPEQGWMVGMPLDVVHIIIRLFKRTEGLESSRSRHRVGDRSRRRSSRLRHFRSCHSRRTPRSPKFDSPIYSTRQEEIRQIDRPSDGMEVDSRHGARVALVHLALHQSRFRASPVISIRRVDVPFLRSDPESRRFPLRKPKRRHAHFVRLVVRGMQQLERFLRPSEEIQSPRTHRSIRRSGD